ncbi:hypothetical protein E4U53_004746 [Claviceps sorghi]|nr:hypothetical protein E4U53_004746 [Claviceps sorghi]
MTPSAELRAQRSETRLMKAQSFSTTRDTAAEKYVYAQLGFIEFGRLPNYAITPVSGRLVDGVFFYKDLRRAGEGPDREGRF